MNSRPDMPPVQGLAASLRAATAGAHTALERATRLPDGILTLHDLAACLGRFHSIVAPLEAQLAAFPDFAAIGLDVSGLCRSQCLQADLAALGATQPPPLSLPPLARFPVALGALYVLEGSALGGKLIERALALRFGASLAGATSFFGAEGRPWAEFKARLDAFGLDEPAAWPDVIAGAAQTFEQYARALSDPPPASSPSSLVIALSAEPSIPLMTR